MKLIKDIKLFFADTLLRNILSPNYYFHIPVGENSFAYPLFKNELILSLSHPERQSLLNNSIRILELFNNYNTCRYLTSVFDLPFKSDSFCVDELEAFIDDMTFDLKDYDDCKRFFHLDNIPLSSNYGIRTTQSQTALVLGNFYPKDYAMQLFDSPITPAQRIILGDSLLPFEKTILVCQKLRARGFETFVSKTHGRHILNIYFRVRALMDAVDVIIVLLSRGSTSIAIEYGLICGDAKLARKAIVFIPSGRSFTLLGSEGCFLLEHPKHYFYDDDKDILVKLDLAIDTFKMQFSSNHDKNVVDARTTN